MRIFSICSVMEKVRRDGSRDWWMVEQWTHWCSLVVAWEHEGQMNWLIEAGFELLRRFFAWCQLVGVLGTSKVFNSLSMSSIHRVERRCCLFKTTTAVAISSALILSRVSICSSLCASDSLALDRLERSFSHSSTDGTLFLQMILVDIVVDLTNRWHVVLN